MRKAMVLFSGGQDSTTCLHWALKNFDEVVAIGFDYGQKHAVELQQAKKIAAAAGVDYVVIDLKGVFSKESALLNHEANVTDQHPVHSHLPASFTSGRNIVFLSIAGGRAVDLGVTNIVTGVCQTDYSGYPDCREQFVKAMQDALILGLDKPSLFIHTPLMFLTKAQTWKLANDLGCLQVVINETHTDYNGNREQFNEWGYGKLDNGASKLRAEGFYEAKENGWLTTLEK